MRTYLSANTVHTQPSSQSIRDGESLNQRQDAARAQENVEIQEELKDRGWV
jgi:hypothetical protein